jgi:N-acetylglucosamine kinase-like BadF-type ATPase
MGPALGVEGGGSHSHAVVADADGELLGIGANDDPANWDDVGIEAAAAAIRSCVREALSRAHLEASDIEASVFTLAGVDFPKDAERLGGIPAAIGLRDPCRISNDAFAALRAGTDESFGVAVIAGTGSVVAGRDRHGEEFRTIGMGPLFGDFGGSSEVSEAGVTAVANAYTHLGPQTLLTERLCARVGVASVVGFLEAASRGRVDTATFAPDVATAANDGDAVAQAILRDAGSRLGDAAAHVADRLSMQDESFDVVLAGGMFRSGSSFLLDPLEQSLRERAPNARIRPFLGAPVVGAALLAIEVGGSTPSPGARTRLATAVAEALGHAPD